MRCFDPNQQVHMVFDASDSLRKCTQAFRRTSELFVKLFAPRRQDKFLSVLCGKYDVSVHADVAHCRTCRWNMEVWHPFRVCSYVLDAIRRCRFAQPTANCFEPLRGAWMGRRR